MSLSGKAVKCLPNIVLGNLNSFWIALDNEFLPSNYVTSLLSEFSARTFQVGEKLKEGLQY